MTNYLENNSFELTIKDAIIFSYKKTIFTIDSTISINNSDYNIYKLNIINEFIYIINNISIINSKNLYNFIQIDNNYKDINNTNTINNISITSVTSVTNKLYTNNINDMLNKESQYINKF